MEQSYTLKERYVDIDIDDPEDAVKFILELTKKVTELKEKGFKDLKITGCGQLWITYLEWVEVTNQD